MQPDLWAYVAFRVWAPDSPKKEIKIKNNRHDRCPVTPQIAIKNNPLPSWVWDERLKRDRRWEEEFRGRAFWK